MKYLRKTQRVDTLRSEIRPRKRGRAGRYVYFALLGGLALILFDVLAGDLVYLRGKGMVAQEVSVIAPEYSGNVLSVGIQPGDRVGTDQPVAELRSRRMLRDIAQLSANLANAQARVSKFRIRADKLAKLLPIARKQAAETARYRDNMAQLLRRGLGTANRSNQATKKAYDAAKQLAELDSEALLVDRELMKFAISADRLRTALDNLESLYEGGIVRARRGGIIGTVSVAQGQGVKEGQRIAEIYHGDNYVLAYVPVGALYDVVPGDAVVVRYGFQTLRGRIDRLLPLAYRLPREFQRAFRTVDREQLVRINMEGDRPPPLFTEVTITWPWSVRALMADAVSYMATRLRAVVAAATAPQPAAPAAPPPAVKRASR
jgi:multidrug resistance efflux pump